MSKPESALLRDKKYSISIDKEQYINFIQTFAFFDTPKKMIFPKSYRPYIFAFSILLLING